MSNLFFRTNIAPYRVDTYNAIHEILGCKMYFMSRTDSTQDFETEKIESRCKFKPIILEKKKIFGVTYYKNIWKILRANRPEIVIVPEFKVLAIQALAYKYFIDRRVKVISMCDDSFDMVAHGNDFTFVHTLARKFVAPFLDNLFLVDEKVCQWYKNKYKKGIWLPIIRDEKIEEPLYKKAEVISNNFRTKYNLEGKRVLLFVGRLVDVKNLKTLIKAVSLTSSDFTTIIVGDGELKESLMQQASQSGKVIIFPGRFDDDQIRAWFNIGDVFVLPSTQEAFGAVTNEALLGGCLVLLSKACGSTCLLNDCNGKIFDPYNPEQLAKLIDETFVDLIDEESIKENKMSISFDEAVVNVIKQLKG